MTDAAFEPTAIDPILDDELVFGDVVPAPRKSRRTPARGRDAAAGAQAPATELPKSAAPDRAAAEEPAEPPVPLPLAGDDAAGSTSSGPPARDRSRLILLAIVGLALFTSLMSLGGLIAVSHTLAAAQAQRSEAQDERAELARLPDMIAALDRAGAQLAAGAARAAALPTVPTQATPPLTADDLRRDLDGLRLALADRQPEGSKAVADTLHAGFNEIGTRLDRIEAQLARPAAPRAAPRPGAAR